MKDPAFLFFPGDWMVGTATFSRHEKGAYMDLLMAQFGSFALTLGEIKNVLGNDFEVIWEVKLRSKFETEHDGILFFNIKLREEMLKRKLFCASRRNNKTGKNQHSKVGHTTSHMKGHTSQHMVNSLRVHTDTTIPDAFKVLKVSKEVVFNFEDVLSKYPNRIGKKRALAHFNASVKNEKDMDDIHIALQNYLKTERVKRGIIQNASTWFNNWRDWIDYKDPVAAVDEEKELLRKVGLDDTGSNSRQRSYNEA